MLASDPKNDLVLLKLKGKGLPFLTLGNSDNIDVGTRIAVIGSPLGLEGTLSEGIVSAVRELIDDMKVLQVTAAISPGSSGSPVLNTNGDVVGVASLLLCGGQSINFAVPSEPVRALLTKAGQVGEVHALGTQLADKDDAVFSDTDSRAAVRAEISRDYLGMLKHAQILTKRYPKSATAWYSLGVAYTELKFNDEAIAAFTQATKIKPGFAEAWDGLGACLVTIGRTDDAVVALQRAVKIKPSSARSWYNLGGGLGRAGRLDDAIAAFGKTLKIKPDYAEAWYGLGVCLDGMRRTDDAIAAYRQAIKIKPEYVESWNNLGTCLDDMKRTDDAIAAYRQAIKTKPDFAEAWRNLGLSLRDAGRNNEATTALAEARRLNPRLFD